MDVKLSREKDRAKFEKLHPDLKRVLVIFSNYNIPFILIETERGRKAQNEAHTSGHSNASFGKSPHNFKPALAFDIGPNPYPGKLSDYKDIAIAMFAAAREAKIAITWGGDWKSLKDWPHFELKNWKTLAKTLAE